VSIAKGGESKNGGEPKREQTKIYLSCYGIVFSCSSLLLLTDLSEWVGGWLRRGRGDVKKSYDSYFPEKETVTLHDYREILPALNIC